MDTDDKLFLLFTAFLVVGLFGFCGYLWLLFKR